MGFLDKMFNKKEKASDNTVCAPVCGMLIDLKDFPDEVFRAGIIGPGCGILPEGEVIRAPFKGTVAALPDSLHALGLQSDSGIELLIHVGIDTVTMEGKGFQALVKQGDTFEKGQKLLRFSKAEIEAAGFNTAVAVIVSNGAACGTVTTAAPGPVDYDSTIITVQPSP